MKGSVDGILATHTGKLFLPDAGYLGMGAAPTSVENVRDEVTTLVRSRSRSA
jgi:hypothetical protein